VHILKCTLKCEPTHDLAVTRPLNFPHCLGKFYPNKTSRKQKSIANNAKWHCLHCNKAKRDLPCPKARKKKKKSVCKNKLPPQRSCELVMFISHFEGRWCSYNNANARLNHKLWLHMLNATESNSEQNS